MSNIPLIDPSMAAEVAAGTLSDPSLLQAVVQALTHHESLENVSIVCYADAGVDPLRILK
jgi:hypothetical protein